MYRGKSDISVEMVLIPAIGEREILLRVNACGICGTDLKKIEYGLVHRPGFPVMKSQGRSSRWAVASTASKSGTG